MRTWSTTPRRKRLRSAAKDCVGTQRHRNLGNRLIADGAFKTTSTPAGRLVTFYDEEGDARSKRGGPVHECFQYVRLRFLLVNLRNRRLHEGHVAGSLRSRRLRRGMFDTAFVRSVQVLGYGSNQAAFQLRVALALEKTGK